MDNLLDKLDAFADDRCVNVIIDTPSGSAAKFKYDSTNRCYKLSRLLPAGAVFPYNFGSIPGTVAEDGDALDVLVLSTVPLFVGCLMQAKLLGVLMAEQTEDGKTIRNDRLLGAAVTEVNPPSFNSLDDVGALRQSEIEQFFISYNRAQGRDFRPLRFGDQHAAEKSVRDAEARRRKSKT
jgi:inorganic pyrophosphatase